MTFDTNHLRHALQQIEAQRAQIDGAVKLYTTHVAQQEAVIRKEIQSFQPAWEQMSRLAKNAVKLFREAYPPNWPENLEIEFLKLEQISETDGIPIFYVPRAEIVLEILKAKDFEERMDCIERRSDDIAHDCEKILSSQVDDELADRNSLALKAATAFIAGHHEAAQALATAICDSYLQTYLTGRYKEMQKRLRTNKSEEALIWPSLRFFYPMAAAVPFLTHWNPRGSEDAPSHLARHVTMHGANGKQINRLNATVSLMLVSTMTQAINAAIEHYGSVQAAFDSLSDA